MSARATETAAPSAADGIDWTAQFDRALHVSDMVAARRLAEQAHEAATTPPARASAALLMARCGLVGGELAVCLSHALDAAALYESLGDADGHARASAVAARCLLTSGDGESALHHALSAMTSAREVAAGRPSQALLAALNAVGNVYRGLGQLDLARDHCEQALDGATRLGDRMAQCVAIETLACVHSAQAEVARHWGRSDEAERLEREAIRCTSEALQIAREQGHVRYEATAVNNLAESMSLVGEAAAALRLLEDWASHTRCDLPWVRLHHLETRGRISLALGKAQEARKLFESALAGSEMGEMQVSTLEHLALACEACGDYQAALGYHRRFHALHVQLAASTAQSNARVAAVRLDTERERERAATLTLANVDLQRHAAVLHRQSTEDPLTGLANRRRLDELLQNGDADCAAAMIDIDHFKSINDRFSHAVGDAVLCQLATLLRDSCREADTAIRLGGEEFLVLLPQMTAPDAATAAERLRACIEAFDWTTLAPALAVTASIGVAMGYEAGSVSALLALADQRLYAAKRSGRNRVVSD